MIAFALANWKALLIAGLVLALGIQEARVRWVKSDFQTYQLNIEKQVADNKTQAALETARMAQNASKAQEALQARLTALNRAYRVLRERSAQPVPSLADATGIAQSCPGEPSKPNPAVRQVGELEKGIEGIIEFGDGEIAKLVELYRLQQENAGSKLPSVAPQ